MALVLDCVGAQSSLHELSYDWRTLALYALGVGARRSELDLLYEGRGPKVLPTFAVVPAYAALMDLLPLTGGDTSAMVHSAQIVRSLGPIPPEGRFQTTGQIDAVYDLKRLAQVVCSTRSEVDGRPAFETEWTLTFRDDGGFGGPRPPKRPTSKPTDDTPVAFEHEESTSEEQALLYRLSGDTNPLHADPEFAKAVGFDAGPILHGLATFGFLGRAVVLKACEGNPERLRALGAYFRRPVWPGDSLRTVAHAAGDRLALRMFAGGRAEAVVTDAWAEIA
jgi:acyl dehydratase